MSLTKDDARGGRASGTPSAVTLSAQRAAETPSANGDVTAAAGDRQVRICTACGKPFAPLRQHYRKCIGCHRAFGRAQAELVRQRTQDGVTCAELREVLPGLAATTPAAAEFLRRVAESSQ